jgi:predicted phosphoribosyltransferase
MFEDRHDAGRQLAKSLGKYRKKKPLVLGIPRGGVEVAYEVATYLNADFSIVIIRKLPLPLNPEAGFGAIAEDGSSFIIKSAAASLNKKEIERIKKEQKQEIKRRLKSLRQNKPLPEIKGRTAILVDDGIAMGSTMRAAIKLCKNKKAGQIIVAVPVSGPRTEREMSKLVDEIVILEKPPFFQAVAQGYKKWHDVTDDEVISTLKNWQDNTAN